METLQTKSIPADFMLGQKKIPPKLGLGGRRLYMVLWCVFLVGTLLGTLLLFRQDSAVSELLGYMVEGFFLQRQQQGFWQTAGASFLGTSLWLLLLFFCGYCLAAQPVILLLVLVRGLGCGYGLGYVYAQNGLSGGMLLVAGLFMPMLLITILLLWAARTSMLLSVRLLKGMEGTLLKQRLGDYRIKFVLLWALSLVVAVLEGLQVLFL